MASGNDTNPRGVEQAFALARERYAALGVDSEAAIDRLFNLSVSLPCWQGDDVQGFDEDVKSEIGGGLAVTGSYRGRARNPDELRADLEQAFALIPGRHRVNLHASYLDWPRKVQRNELAPEHYQRWVDWAGSQGVGLDFNPTFFAHPRASDGWSLAHRDPSVRQFWIEHAIACRRIGASFGAALGTACVTNVWIPDGFKDTPGDRMAPRERLLESLDRIFAEPLDPACVLDALEAKLFGLGSESYVAGSHEFYLGYAVSRRKILCLDSGHFHPTESIADKITSILLHVPALLLHVSRGVRWDSDHVPILGDDLIAIAQELVRGSFLRRTHLGLDFFDASINRIAGWVVGARSLLKALLFALLEPVETLRTLEEEGDYTGRLALLEEMKTMPFGAVWDFACVRGDVPAGAAWLEVVRRYEREVLAHRD